MRYVSLASFTCALVLGLATEATAQHWPATSLVLRTNGATLRPGECVRLTLLATDDVVGPFAPSVSLAFTRNLTLEASDGTQRVVPRRMLDNRPAGATLDRLIAGASVVLDDALCFGQGSAPGPYEITVSLASSSLPTVQLSTCVEFQSDDVAEPPARRCAFGLRGVVRRDVPGSVALDATVSSGALYRLLVFRADRLIGVIENGLTVTRPDELTVEGGGLSGLEDAPVDLVLHDLVGNRFASASRIAVGRAPQY